MCNRTSNSQQRTIAVSRNSQIRRRGAHDLRIKWCQRLHVNKYDKCTDTSSSAISQNLIRVESSERTKNFLFNRSNLTVELSEEFVYPLKCFEIVPPVCEMINSINTSYSAPFKQISGHTTAKQLHIVYPQISVPFWWRAGQLRNLFRIGKHPNTNCAVLWKSAINIIFSIPCCLSRRRSFDLVNLLQRLSQVLRGQGTAQLALLAWRLKE